MHYIRDCLIKLGKWECVGCLRCLRDDRCFLHNHFSVNQISFSRLASCVDFVLGLTAMQQAFLCRSQQIRLGGQGSGPVSQ